MSTKNIMQQTPMANIPPATSKLSVLSLSETESESQNVKRRQVKKKIKLTKKERSAHGSETDISQIRAMELTENSENDMTHAFKLKAKKRRLTDESNDEFTHPMTKQLPQQTKQVNTTTFNKFEQAGKIINQKDMHIKPVTTDNKNNDETEQKQKQRPPPPIVIHGLFNDHKKLNAYLTSKLKEKYYWKHTSQTTILQVATYEDWVVANENFEKGNLEFHTYTPKKDKNHAFILRGLYHDLDVDALKEELLIEYQIPVRQVYEMKGTRFQSYMVVTASDITLNKIQKIKYLDHTVVRWERHVNNKKIIQCHRCQLWGHATSNCRASPRCLKCAKSHLTNTCTKSKEVPPKCANCGEAHPANSVSCRIYQNKLWQLERKNVRVPPALETKYVAAQVPNRNVWEDRKQSQTQNSHLNLRQQNKQMSVSNMNFPPLPSMRGRGESSISPVAPKSQASPLQNQETQRTQPQPTRASGGPAAFAELQSQYRRVEALINLELMTQRVRLLANKLEECGSESEKFQVFYTFMIDIDNNAV